MATLSPPWVTFYRKLDALFGADPQVNVLFDEDDFEIKLCVKSGVKAEAIEALLPSEKKFGNVKVKIAIIPANDERDKVSLIRSAFDGNPALSYIHHVSTPIAGEVDYVVFANKVVQFFNDDLGDVNGNMSTLHQDIAKDVIEPGSGVFFCTDTESNLGKPLGEWP